MEINHVFIATNNKGKVAEFQAFFADHGIEVKSLLDLNEAIDVVEDGSTFEENARKKAETIGKMINQPVIADDSGLEIDALDGRPGIYSARYAGPEKDDGANIQKVLNDLENVPIDQRTARFVCALAVYIPGQVTKTISGTCEGIIEKEKHGTNGFGYDPIFYLPDLDKTMAELDRTEKNKISHRASALKQLAEKWVDWIV